MAEQQTHTTGLTHSIMLPVPEYHTQVLSLDGADWRVATDPQNQGREKGWGKEIREDAKSASVPGVIQTVFPNYHGVAWYWRSFDVPANPHENGRYLLRFHAVDYLAEVWVNGKPVGGHEGGETPFVLDITDAVKPEAENLLALRVLNPTEEAIDGYTLNQTPHGCKKYPVQSNAVYNSGGIVDSVELMVTPAAHIEDLHVVPNWQSGDILARVNVRNGSKQPVVAILQVTVSPSINGTPCASAAERLELDPGDTLVECLLKVPNHKLWSLEDPFLYRVDACLQETDSGSADVRSTRCGFRDFRFENGWFRLNGKRIFPHGNLYHTHFPVTYTWSLDLDMVRRDVVNMKATGMNLCRIVFGGSLARQLDIFDEVGVLVYMEHYGAWQLADSPKMAERFDRSLGEIIRRDRNHPSVVIWGALNETPQGPVFQHAYKNALPLIRALDNTRMVILESGTFHEDHGTGSYSNPGSLAWQHGLLDTHDYPSTPHDTSILSNLRGWFTISDPRLQTAGNKLFISEYGQCGAVNLPRYLRQYENRGHESSDDAVYFRKLLEMFTADWQRYRLDEIWPRQEDYFEESQRTLATLRRIAANALRANPNLAAYSSSYTPAEGGFHGSGMADHFRLLKPGHTDVVFEETAPLRWCLFVNRVSIYRGDTVRLEAVLSNQDVLKPGEYPARIQVVGPAGIQVLNKVIQINVPPPRNGIEPPFALPVFDESLKIDGPQGRYRFVATLERGGAAAAGEADFHVFDPAAMPAVDAEVTLWGNDEGLRDFLEKRNIRVKSFQDKEPTKRELILACGEPPAPRSAAFTELARRIARGSSVVFLDINARLIPGSNCYAIPAKCSTVFSKEGDETGEDPTWYMPRHEKGSYENISIFCPFYRADHWVKNHPVFDGLPSGGIMDYHFYRDMIRNPNMAFTGINNPEEAIAGAVRVSGGLGGDDYKAGLTVFTDRLGAGKFLVNDLKIRENLGDDPVAERLLRNMLNYMARGLDQPLEPLPADFSDQLKAIGYEIEK